MTSEKVIEKLQKVLELARRGGSEGEAQAAMRMAHELLAKHNLSLGEVESYTKEEDMIQEEFEGLGRLSWQHYIHNSVAKLYFCFFIRNKDKNILVGRRSNIAVVRYVASYLIETGERLAKEAGSGTTFRNSFKKGFASRISERVKEEIARAKQGEIKDDAGNSLILSPLYDKTDREVKLFLRNVGMKTKATGRRTVVSNSDAYQAGKEQANSVSLRTQGITHDGKRVLGIS